MITRKQIRDKVEDILKDREYKKKYYNNSGVIPNNAPTNINIPSEDIDMLLDGMFNKTARTDRVDYSLGTIDLDTNERYLAAALNPGVKEKVIENPSNFTCEILNDRGEVEKTLTLDLEDFTAGDEWDTVIFSGVGTPIGTPIEQNATKIWTYTIPEKGEFFEDLNTDCLLAAAVYELANEAIEVMETRLKKYIDQKLSGN